MKKETLSLTARKVILLNFFRPDFKFAALTLIDRLSVKSHIQFSLIHSCYGNVQWTPFTFKVNVEMYWELILKAVISIRVPLFFITGVININDDIIEEISSLAFSFLQVQRRRFVMFWGFLVLVTAQFIFFIYPLIRNQWQSLWHLSPNPFNSISQQLLYHSSRSSGCALPAPLSFVSSFYIPFHSFSVSSEQEISEADILWVQEYRTASRLVYIGRVLAHWIAAGAHVAFVNKVDI